MEERTMPIYRLTKPNGAGIPVIASLPHSGRRIPHDIYLQFRPEVRDRLPGLDRHLEKLYDFLPGLGVTTLFALHSRYVVDLNRDRRNAYGSHSSSVVYRETIEGLPLYDTEPSENEIEDRISRYYQPYHRTLEELLQDIVAAHGRALLIDLHSFGTSEPDADIVLGDVNGESCPAAVTDAFASAFNMQGFSVARNERWVGGYITRRYWELANVSTLQVEIRFSAYLDATDYGTGDIIDTVKFENARQRVKAAFVEGLPNF